MFQLKTLTSAYDYDMDASEGVVTKVEKWNSTESTTNTHVSGGGGKIGTNLLGETTGKIAPTSVNVTNTTYSYVNTRIYYGEGEYVTLNNCDFITAEGNTIKIHWFVYKGKYYPIKVVDKKTGYSFNVWSFDEFADRIIGVRRQKIKKNSIGSGIGLAIAVGVFFWLKLSGWWLIFIIPVVAFIWYLFWNFFTKDLLTDIRNFLFHKDEIIDLESERENKKIFSELSDKFNQI